MKQPSCIRNFATSWSLIYYSKARVRVNAVESCPVRDGARSGRDRRSDQTDIACDAKPKAARRHARIACAPLRPADHDRRRGPNADERFHPCGMARKYRRRNAAAMFLLKLGAFLAKWRAGFYKSRIAPICESAIGIVQDRARIEGANRGPWSCGAQQQWQLRS